MADLYLADGIVNCAASPGATALSVVASALTRGRIDFFNLSATGTPADNVIQWLVRRISAAGTSSAVTPRPVDPAAPAAQLSAQQTYTAEPTFGVQLMDLGVHQRAYYQWQALPGREILVPATASNGVSFTAINGSFTGQVDVTVQWEE